MRNNLKSMSRDSKRVVGNFVSLSILHSANYLLPLIVLPYLVRVLGPDKFGLVAFAQALVVYFALMADYGFSLSATREVSVHREDPRELSRIFSCVMTVEAILTVGSFLLLLAVVFGSAKLRGEWQVCVLTFGMVVGQFLFPVWFFQGMETMKYITALNITAKMIFLAAVFLFVREPSDYVYVPALNSLGFVTSGCVSMWLVYRKFKIRFVRVGVGDLVRTLRSGFHFFITSALSGQISLSTAAFVIGVFHTTATVGYFAVADKLLRGLVMLRMPVTASLYPFFSRRFQQSVPKTLGKVFKVQIFLSAVYIPLLLGVIVLARQIITLISGSEYALSVPVLRIGAAYVLFNMYNSVVGVIIMINLGLQRQLMWIRVVKYSLFVLLLILVVSRSALVGPISLIVAAEIAETLLYVVLGIRSRIWREYKDARAATEVVGELV